MSEKIDLSFCNTCELRGKSILEHNGRPIYAQICARAALDFASQMSSDFAEIGIDVMTFDGAGKMSEVPAEEALSPFVQELTKDAAMCIEEVQRTGKPFVNNPVY